MGLPQGPAGHNSITVTPKESDDDGSGDDKTYVAAAVGL